MPSVIDGSASATFQTPLPVAQGGTGGTTSVGTGSAVMLSSQSGSAPVFGCRAWCTFDGTLTGTNAPTNGGNVTSVTRNSTGDYTINFTTALPTASYAYVVGAHQNAAGVNVTYTVKKNGGTQTTTAFQILSVSGDRASAQDNQFISVAIFC